VPIAFGSAKPLEAITLADALAHPIWVWALDDEGALDQDETWQKPILQQTDLTASLLRASLTQIITLRVLGTTFYASGEYSDTTERVDALAVWHNEAWTEVRSSPLSHEPFDLVAVPTIRGAVVRFRCNTPSSGRATKVG
jgi:hypothetical protein